MEEINIVLKKYQEDVSHYCTICARVVTADIYGLFEKESGGLVAICDGHQKHYVCSHCKRKEIL